MGFGMARALACALVLGCGLSAAAQDIGQEADVPLSPQCEAPAARAAANEPLENAAASLQRGRTLRVLAIGSSSTSGVGASSRAKTYPVQLTDLLLAALKGVQVEVTNRGVSGEVVKSTAERLKSEVAQHKPDLVVWQLGTNDALSRVPTEEVETTVSATLDWLRENRVDVVLVGPQYTTRYARDPAYAAMREMLRKVAEQHKVLYVRRYDAMQAIASARASQQMMASDNFHLNDLGYQCMAEHIARAVVGGIHVRKYRPGGMP